MKMWIAYLRSILADWLDRLSRAVDSKAPM